MKMFLVFFFLLIATSAAHTPGAVTVDKYTFDKILRNFDIVFVKFDDKFTSGDKHEQFKKFAESAAYTKRLLVAEIPINTHDDHENEELAKQYGVTKEDYPAYKLFLKDKSKPITYAGDKSEDDLKRFISHHTNLWFGLPGTLEELDFVARDFFDASSSNDAKGQKVLLKKAREQFKTLVDKKDQKNGEAYIKIMEAIAKQGIEFLQREGRRVQNLLKGKMTNEKREELQHRANILLSFKSAKESVMYKINDIKDL